MIQRSEKNFWSASMLTSHKRAFLAYVPFLLFWGLDYLTKSWIAETHTQVVWGPLHFVYHENHGIILGSLGQLPSIIRSVFLTTIGISIVSSYPMLLNLIYLRSRKMILGVALLFSGIMGNVTDRIIYGFVIDMIFVRTPWFTTPVFNLADLVQWIGYSLIALSISREINRHVPEGDRRKFQWIMPSFQYKFCLTIVGLVFFVTSVFLIFGLTFLKYILEETGQDLSMFLLLYFISSLSIQIVLCLAAIIIGKIISSKVAGPVLGIGRYLEDTLKGKRYGFKLREEDPFKELENPLTELNKRVNPGTDDSQN